MRQGNVPPRRDQDGFTLVEVMVAAMVLMIGMLGTFIMIDGANRTTRDNNARAAATALSREILEQSRTVDYEKVSPSQLLAELRAKPDLGGTLRSDGKWVLRRKNIAITVGATICTYDDPTDGRASSPPANACPPGAGSSTSSTGNADSNPDDFRRVTLTLEWQQGRRTNRIVQTSQLNNPGGGLGPRILTFPSPFGGAQLTSGTEVPFTATSTSAHTVTWTIDDGRPQGRGDIVGPATSWSWKWPIGTVDAGAPRVDWVVDGAYTANVQPRDSRGVPGELRVASVLVNRRVPLKPNGFAGGRSGINSGHDNVVEMDWLPSVERDIIGYRVVRIDGSTPTPICPATATGVTTALSCTDPKPPSGNLRYQLVAVDRTDLANPASAPRDGDPVYIDVPATFGTILEAPGNFHVFTTNGHPDLSWTAPSGTVLFYRIYRDGVRYARTGGAETGFRDLNPGSAHEYRVSAVHDNSYNEGALSLQRRWPPSGF